VIVCGYNVFNRIMVVSDLNSSKADTESVKKATNI
jgi:hypothetical protein